MRVLVAWAWLTLACAAVERPAVREHPVVPEPREYLHYWIGAQADGGYSKFDDGPAHDP